MTTPTGTSFRYIRVDGARVRRIAHDEDFGRVGTVKIEAYNNINGRNMTVVYDVTSAHPEPKTDTTSDPSDFELV